MASTLLNLLRLITFVLWAVQQPDGTVQQIKNLASYCRNIGVTVRAIRTPFSKNNKGYCVVKKDGPNVPFITKTKQQREDEFMASMIESLPMAKPKHAPPIVEPTPQPAPEPEAAPATDSDLDLVITQHILVPAEADELPPPPLSFVDEVLSLKEQFESKREAAIVSLLAAEKDIHQKLAALGYKRPVVDDAPPKWVNTPGGGYQRSQPARGLNRPPVHGADRYCKICDVNGHDARAHKGQTKKKKFTPAELDRLTK